MTTIDFLSKSSNPIHSVQYRTNHAGREKEAHHTYHSSQMATQAHPCGPVLPCEHGNGASTAQPLGSDGFLETGGPRASELIVCRYLHRHQFRADHQFAPRCISHVFHIFNITSSVSIINNTLFSQRLIFGYTKSPFLCVFLQRFQNAQSPISMALSRLKSALLTMVYKLENPYFMHSRGFFTFLPLPTLYQNLSKDLPLTVENGTISISILKKYLGYTIRFIVANK